MGAHLDEPGRVGAHPDHPEPEVAGTVVLAGADVDEFAQREHPRGKVVLRVRA